MKNAEIWRKIQDLRLNLDHDKMTYGELRKMLNEHPEWDDLEIRIAESTSGGERATYIPKSLIWVHSLDIFNRTFNENHNGVILKVTKQWEAILEKDLDNLIKFTLTLGDE